MYTSCVHELCTSALLYKIKLLIKKNGSDIDPQVAQKIFKIAVSRLFYISQVQ